jgi:hypothetical protein
MTISDLSYLETPSTAKVEGGDNFATVHQYASASAGNNHGYYNRSYFNVAKASNSAFVYQSDSDYYGYPYYYYYW